MKKRNIKVKGFSITEMLLVIIIIGIIIMIALPDHTSVIGKAKALEAKMQLSQVEALQKAHFWANSKYSSDLNEIGFSQELLITEGGNANYKIEIIDASNSTFLARATSITDFDQDGKFNIWEISHEKKLIEIQAD